MKTPDLRGIVWTNGFRNLLLWLMAYFLIGPFLEGHSYAHTVMGVFLTVALFSSIYTVNKQGWLLSMAITLLVLTVVLTWGSHLGWFPIPTAVLPAMLALYLGTLLYSFLNHLAAARRVDGDVICAALCTYLVLGLFWGALFNLLEVVSPSSFAGGLLDAATDAREKAYTLQYFSFVTLSTLGYGDITPHTRSAAALCQVEAVLGQFFTVVLVARLVGVQVAQESVDRAAKDRPSD